MARTLPWWKKLVFAVATSAFLVLFCELVLAWAGVKPIVVMEDPYVGFASTSQLFQTSASSPAIVETSPAKLDFFNYQSFPKQKPGDTFRIFTLGGSTTYGRPFEDDTSFSGWLRSYVQAAAPERAVEVINCGAISYASYRVARVMEELLDYEPDLFIIYSGNNEFLERRTYQGIIDEPRPLTALRRGVHRLRLYSLGLEIGRRRARQAQQRYELAGEVDEILNRSTGLDVYHRDDTLKDQVLAHYRFNLGRMVELAQSAGAQVILATVPVNEKDFAPFKSEERSGLEAHERRRFRTLLEEAIRALDEGRPGDTDSVLAQALDIDPRFAQAHYLRGRALLALGSYAAAGESFRTAIQEDVCPLRAMPAANAIVAEVARSFDVPVVDLVDVFRRRQQAVSGHSILGREFFLDHVHPTVQANGVVARALVDEMRARRIFDLEPAWHDEVGAAVAAEVEGRVNEGDRARAFKNLSKVLIWAGKREQAEEYARWAQERLEGDWEASYNAGVVALETGRHQDAIEAFQQAVDLNPQAAQAHDYLSAAFGAVGELERAIAASERAVALDPSLAIAHNNLGTFYTRRGDLEAAERSIRRALKLDPDFAEASNNLGNVHLAGGRHEAALEAYERALKLRPRYVEAWVNRGAALGEVGRFGEAARSYQRALELDPDRTAAHLGLGRARLELGEAEGASAAFEEVLARDSTSLEGIEGLARSLASMKRDSAALEVLDRALELHSRDPGLHHLYGQVLLGRGEAAAAISHLEKALDGDASRRPGAPPPDLLHHTLATALMLERRVKEGRFHLQRALELNGQNARVRNDLGLVAEFEGDLETALQHFEAALRLDPAFTLAAENSQRVRRRLDARSRP